MSFIRSGAVSLVTLGVLVTSFYFVRTHTSLSLKYQKEGVMRDGAWEISFGQDVAILGTPHFVPEVSGTWYKKQSLFGVSGLTFRPKTGFNRGATYTVVLPASRTYGNKDEINVPQIAFSTAPPAGLKSFVVDKGATRATLRPTVEAVLSKDLADEVLTLSVAGQASSFEEVSREGDHVVWRSRAELPQGARLTLELRDQDYQTAQSWDFETVSPPRITAFQASNPIFPGDHIKVSVNTPLATTTPSLNFSIPGSGSWIDPTTYDFVVGKVQGGITYAISLPRGAQSLEGGRVLEDDVRAVTGPGEVVPMFTTLGRNRRIHDPIEVAFDQPVDRQSAERAFRIAPAARGDFSWRGNTMIFTPEKLDYQKTYVASLDAGVRAKFGLPSGTKARIALTTEPEVFKLDVPYFNQQYARSCEAAALRMALAYRGVTTNDMDILQKFGYDPRPKDKEKNEWDDPRLMFVGDVSDGDGYGVYGAPVAKAAQAFGRQALFTKEITPQFLAREVKAGNPVMLWGYTSLRKPPYTWRVANGDDVKVISGEHVRLVVGVHGSVENPLGFFIHDPINAQQYEYWDTATLMAHTNAVPDVTNQAVAVR